MDKCFVFEFGSCEIIQLNLELGRKLGKYISSIFFLETRGLALNVEKQCMNEMEKREQYDETVRKKQKIM